MDEEEFDDELLDEEPGEENASSEDEIAQAIEDEVNKQAKELAKSEIKALAKKGGKAIGSAAKAGGKAIASGVSSLITAIAPFLPYILIGLLIVLVVFIAVFAIVGAVNPAKNIDIENGQFDTAFGITGENFYGARIVYYDQEKATQELETYYENFVSNVLLKIDEINGVELAISLNYAYARPDQLTEMIRIVADVVDGSEEELNLSESIAKITHFGYTTNELALIEQNLANYIANNPSVIVVDESVYTGDFINDFSLIFNTNFSTYNVVAPLYYVKDIVLENSSSMISGLTNANYVAMIYMPREDVVFDELSYMFYLKEETTVDCKIKSSSNGVETELAGDTVDSSWWDKDDYKTIALENQLLNCSKFTAFNETQPNFINGQSMYSLIFTENNIDLTIPQQYFAINQVSTEGENADNYFQISYLPSGNETDNIIYLTFDASGEFQFCEERINLK
ncbi:MAG: hypothetical protein IJX26_04665 [Clostridia bacterium]|nr:hypothetical protein [Clostridia bacterium]